MKGNLSQGKSCHLQNNDFHKVSREEKRKRSPAKDQNLTELGSVSVTTTEVGRKCLETRGLHFLMTDHAEHLSVCLLALPMSSTMQGTFKSSAHF